jgi:DNA-binding beta-propeller fold protein YncE
MHRWVPLCVLAAAAACRPSADPAAPPPQLTFSGQPTWPETSTYPGVGSGRLVITNSYEDSLSVFDLALVGQSTLPELKRVPVGLNPIAIEAPHHFVASPAGDFIFPALSNYAPGTGTGPHGAHGTGTIDGYVLKLSTDNHRLVAQARVDKSPGDLALSPDGKTLAVTHFDLQRITDAARGSSSPDARLILLDTDTMARRAAIDLCPAPHGVAFSKDGKRLYAACLSDEIAVVDLSGAEPIVTRVKVAADSGDAFLQKYQPYAVAVSPLTGDVAVSCLLTKDVRVLKANGLTFDATRQARLAGAPYLPSFSADGTKLWVPSQGDDVISEVDTSNGAVLRTLSLPAAQCRNVHQVTPTRDGKYLAVICEGLRPKPGTLLIVDAFTLAVLSHTEVGLFPDNVGFVFK